MTVKTCEIYFVQLDREQLWLVSCSQSDERPGRMAAKTTRLLFKRVFHLQGWEPGLPDLVVEQAEARVSKPIDQVDNTGRNEIDGDLTTR